MEQFRGFENEKSISEIVRGGKIVIKILRTSLIMSAWSRPHPFSAFFDREVLTTDCLIHISPQRMGTRLMSAGVSSFRISFFSDQAHHLQVFLTVIVHGAFEVAA